MWYKIIAAVVVTVAVSACSRDSAAPTELTLPLFEAEAQADPDFKRGTLLLGAEEVFTPANPGDPTPAQSPAIGEAIFRVSENETTVTFKLFVRRISNVIMVHIHCGRFGQNGPVAMWLHPVIGPTGAPLTGPTGPQNGQIAAGTFALGTVMCPASAVGVDMPLLEAIRQGLAYVNVHTNDGVGATNTGPGDFPGGEIRGQLDHSGTTAHQ